jgi:hypothetical protein
MSHGEAVVQAISEGGLRAAQPGRCGEGSGEEERAIVRELEGFVRGWRQHFLDAMRPHFLPPHWRVDARVANSSL